MEVSPNAILKKVTFTGAKLSKVRFSHCKLNGADFTGADLKSALLHGSVLTGVNFTNANLTKASLNWSDLRGADLSAAVLKETEFLDAVYDDVTKFPDGFKPASMKWKGKGLAPLVYGAATARSKPAKTIKPIDFETLMKNLLDIADSDKLKKALSMLKKDRFQLFFAGDAEQCRGHREKSDRAGSDLRLHTDR